MIRQDSVSRVEVILAVDGPLAGEAVEDFHRRMVELAAGSFLTITLDLSRTTTINSTAIGKLIFFSRKLAESRKILRIQGCSEGVYRIFKALQLDKLIKMEMQSRGQAGNAG